MQIKTTDKFLKSLKRTAFQQSRIYTIYSFFRRKIPKFFKNIWAFRKEVSTFSWWDFRYNISLLRKSLEITSHGVESKGIEVDESRLKKVKAMKELIEILKVIEEDSYLELAEKELGELPNRPIEFRPCEDPHDCYEIVDNDTEEDKNLRKLIYKRADEIEEQSWDRMARIIRGQKREEIESKGYDGTGMRGWWD
jgi:hypothetical protein